MSYMRNHLIDEAIEADREENGYEDFGSDTDNEDNEHPADELD
jgi:hypothetical protein